MTWRREESVPRVPDFLCTISFYHEAKFSDGMSIWTPTQVPNWVMCRLDILNKWKGWKTTAMWGSAADATFQGKKRSWTWSVFCCAIWIKRDSVFMLNPTCIFRKDTSQCRATEEEKKKTKSAERDRLPSALIWPSDWWPRAASSLNRWPHAKGGPVTGRSTKCENEENRMRDE